MKIKTKGTKPKDTKSWNPFVGCNFDCVYCKANYRHIVWLNGIRWNCTDCQTYIPHNHPERLDRMPSDRVIFVLSNGDISFCDPVFLDEIVDVMKNDKKEGRVFLLQSKNPACFANILQELPQNVVLMTTIETNRDSMYSGVSKAPLPSQRFQDFLQLAWPRKAMVMEPILKFDLDIIKQWAMQLKPEVIFIGLESHRKCKDLVEPSPSEVEELHRDLRALGFKTYDKAKSKYRDAF
ncbi:MAG: hypothetical protein FJ123_00080 [Deltaproteobacteria bacterium]|nr:hypothetical protein [Deltaproteobacteria bacterium]